MSTSKLDFEGTWRRFGGGDKDNLKKTVPGMFFYVSHCGGGTVQSILHPRGLGSTTCPKKERFNNYPEGAFEVYYFRSCNAQNGRNPLSFHNSFQFFS